MDRLEVLERAGAEFERRLAAVEQDQWELPTPCEGWDVTELVHHVVRGNAMGAAIVRGASRAEAVTAFESAPVGDDPLATYRAGAADQLAAFREPGALDRTVHHPMGDLPADQVLGFRIADLAVHGWDLARATGGDEHLDDAVATSVWEDLQPLLPMIGAIGVFGAGPSGTLGDDDPVEARVLDALGRRP